MDLQRFLSQRFFCSLLLGGLLLWSLFLTTGMAVAQTVVRGAVTDANTGEPLPSATVQVQGTYKGTIANREGQFALRVDSLPTILRVRFIGYETSETRVTSRNAASLDIALAPSVLDMEEVVVTGANFAENIMRRVIERKRTWWDSLRTYQVDAYNRFTVSNDTGIVSIIETQTDAYWRQGEGTREIQRARRQTANLDFEEALPAALFVANLYEDNIEIAGHNLIGVTHPDALRHYEFTLEGTRAIDGQRVYDIAVKPTSRRKTAFVGRVAVLDSVYALLSVELRPSDAFLFPPPIDEFEVTYKQQFSDFAGQFWLPVDFRSSVDLGLSFARLLAIPTIHIEQVSRLSEYEVNVPVPDSLFEDDEAVVAMAEAVEVLGPDTLAADTLGALGTNVPLSEAERRAYEQIDSTATLDKAFAPTGPLARLVDMETESDSEGVSSRAGVGGAAQVLPFDLNLEPEVWFNRTDALHLGARIAPHIGQVRLDGRLGYNLTEPFDDDLADAAGQAGRTVDWTYGGGASVRIGARQRTTLGAQYDYGTDLMYTSDLYDRLGNSGTVLLGGDDYFNYYGAERVRGFVERRFRPLGATIRLQYNNERQFSVPRITSYDVLGESNRQPINPAISGGEDALLRSLSLRVALGDEPVPFGIVGQNRLELVVEHSNPDLIDSDFDFTRVQVSATARIPTFYRRRFLSNVLDVKVVGGTFAGTLPVQRFGIVDATIQPFTVFGALRVLDERPYIGEQYLGIHWEHSFRTVPFELIGWEAPIRQGYNVILHGGHGRSWIGAGREQALFEQGVVFRTPDGFHHEIGLSLSGLFDLLRVDVTKRLDAEGWAIGIGAARLF